jgi:Na+-transporting methylmalonyl-CoA/oxaloacetate decarboxylase gamma subunit
MRSIEGNSPILTSIYPKECSYMKKTLFLVVLVTLVAFVSNVFAQTQEAVKAAGQDAAKKTEMKKDETKTVVKEKGAESKKEVKAATGEKASDAMKATGEKVKPVKKHAMKKPHDAKKAEKATEAKDEVKKEVEKK